MIRIRRHHTAALFLERAESWLLRNEAEYNLLLGLAYRLQRSDAGFESPIYFATVEQGSELVGCAFRTPPQKVGLTRMPLDAVKSLAADLAQVYDTIPGVLAAEPESRAFADEWSALRGLTVRQGQRNRIHQLERVVPPSPMPPGHMRQATMEDADLVARWFAEFETEAHAQPGGASTVERRIRDGTVFLWDDDGPRSMGGVAAETPHGARIGFVYTPRTERGRGYAAANTAAISERMLKAGKRFCFLYTDLANPTSNAIYARIGYEPVCDVNEWLFTAQAVRRDECGLWHNAPIR